MIRKLKPYCTNDLPLISLLFGLWEYWTRREDWLDTDIEYHFNSLQLRKFTPHCFWLVITSQCGVSQFEPSYYVRVNPEEPLATTVIAAASRLSLDHLSRWGTSQRHVCLEWDPRAIPCSSRCVSWNVGSSSCKAGNGSQNVRSGSCDAREDSCTPKMHFFDLKSDIWKDNASLTYESVFGITVSQIQRRMSLGMYVEWSITLSMRLLLESDMFRWVSIRRWMRLGVSGRDGWAVRRIRVTRRTKTCMRMGQGLTVILAIVDPKVVGLAPERPKD